MTMGERIVNADAFADFLRERFEPAAFEKRMRRSLSGHPERANLFTFHPPLTASVLPGLFVSDDNKNPISNLGFDLSLLKKQFGVSSGVSSNVFDASGPVSLVYTGGRDWRVDPDYIHKMVPSEEVRRGILFANCESYEVMRERVFDDLETLSREMGIVREGWGRESSVLFQALGLVERSMEGSARGTGEPTFAHILRMLVRGMDLVWGNLRYLKEVTFPFDKDTAVLFFLTISLHELVEKENGGPAAGKIAFIEDAEGTDDRLRISRLDKNSGKVVESLDIDIDRNPYYITYLRQALKIVGLSGDVPETQFLSLRGFPNTVSQITTSFGSRGLLLYIPWLAKIIDRLDNSFTRTFGQDEEGEFTPRDPRGIRNKALENLTYFPELEWIMPYVCGHDILKSSNMFTLLPGGLLYLLASGMKERRRNDALLQKTTAFLDDWLRSPHEVGIWKPSRWAILTLLGLGPNEIFARNSWNVPGPWIPRVI